MKIKTPTIKGKYKLELFREGKLLQEVVVHNLVTKQFVSELTGNYTFFSQCAVGQGSREPLITDTSLASQLFKVAYSAHKLKEVSTDKLTWVWEYTYVFPAGSSYVGTIREIGLMGGYQSTANILLTHALVVDSEGTPIEIEKTYLDELIVTAQITVKIPSWTTGQTWCLPRVDWLSQPLIGMTGDYANLSPQWSFCGGPHITGRPSLVRNALTYSSQDPSISCSMEYGNINKYRGTADNGPYKDYVNSLVLGSTKNNSMTAWHSPAFRILFPNVAVFPITTLQNLALGTGDGSTSIFSPELPAWLEGTEVVYKNGVALVRDVDYHVDHLHNSQGHCSVSLGYFVCDVDSPRWEYVSSLFSGDTSCIWGADCYSPLHTNSNSWVGYIPVVDTNSPMIIKYATQCAFSSKINKFKLGTWRSNIAEIPLGVTLVFYYSQDDGLTWTEFGRMTNNNSRYYIMSDSTIHSIPTVDGITQVKVEMENAPANFYLFPGKCDSFFMYQGEGAVHFTTPPAVGDVLTMDVQIDRPWKDADNVIQWNPIIVFDLTP